MRTVFAFVAVALLAAPALAADEHERTIVIENHRFSPELVEVPKDVRVKLIIDNRDATPEEFESNDLRREKVVAGRSKGTVYVGPLPAGEYKFFGDFNQATAQGKLVAK